MLLQGAPGDAVVLSEIFLYPLPQLFLSVLPRLRRELGTLKPHVLLHLAEQFGVGTELDVAHADIIAAHFLQGLAIGQGQIDRQREVAYLRNVEPVAVRSSRIMQSRKVISVACMSPFVSEQLSWI